MESHLLENGEVEEAQKLHAEISISIEELKPADRFKYAEFALATKNDALFMEIFKYEVGSVDCEMENSMNFVISLIYLYARSRDAQAAISLWEIVKNQLPDTLTKVPYANFLKKIRGDPTLSLNPDTAEIALAQEKRAFMAIRNTLISTGDWLALYKLIKENITTLLNADEGNNMGLLGQDIQALFDAHKHDLAFQLWLQILKLKPACADAAFRFAKKNKSYSRYKTKLLSRTNEYKKTRSQPSTAVGHLPPALQASEVSIGNESKRVTDWFKVAATLASQANYTGAVTILFDLVNEIPSSTSIVSVKISNMLMHLNTATALSILNIATSLRKRPQLAQVFNSVAARLLQRGQPQLADAIYAELKTIVASSEWSHSKAVALIKIGNNQEAVAVMLESIEKYPHNVFNFILHLLHKNLFEHCLALYKALQVRSKDFSLPFVYAVLRQHNDERFRANVFQLVLPETKGPPMSTDEITVVSLVFDFLDWHPNKKLDYINELERNRALPHEVVGVLQSKAQTAFIRQKIAERDKAIEDFVEAQMPTLQTGNFFDAISVNLQILNPGKRTSRMARSVLINAERLSPNNTIPGKKDRKS